MSSTSGFSKFIWITTKVLVLCIFFGLKSNSQDITGCISKLQLLKMQSSAVQDIRLFLLNEEWTLSEVKASQTYLFQNYPMEFELISWKKTDYSSSGSIFLYHADNRSNIVFLELSSSCFRELSKQFSLNSASLTSEEGRVITTYTINDLIVEFTEASVSSDRARNQFSVLVYSRRDMQKAIEALKAKNDLVRIAETNCNAFCSISDSLCQNNQLDDASRFLDSAKECSMDFTSVKIKIVEIEKKITEKKIKALQLKADESLESGKYDLALDLYRIRSRCSFYRENQTNRRPENFSFEKNQYYF
jgi:hypothetical protein